MRALSICFANRFSPPLLSSFPFILGWQQEQRKQLKNGAVGSTPDRYSCAVACTPHTQPKRSYTSRPSYYDDDPGVLRFTTLLSHRYNQSRAVDKRGRFSLVIFLYRDPPHYVGYISRWRDEQQGPFLFFPSFYVSGRCFVFFLTCSFVSSISFDTIKLLLLLLQLQLLGIKESATVIKVDDDDDDHHHLDVKLLYGNNKALSTFLCSLFTFSRFSTCNLIGITSSFVIIQL